MIFNNYLEDLTYHEKIGETDIRICGIASLIRKLLDEIKYYKGHGHINLIINRLDVQGRTFHQWRTGLSPIPISTLYRLIDLWGEICKKSKSEIKDKKEEFFLSTDYFSIPKGKMVKLPKNLDNNLAYFLGYLMGDGFLGDLEKSIVKNGGTPQYTVRFASYDLELAKNLFMPRFFEIFKIKGATYGLNSNCFDCHIDSKVIFIFLNKVCEIPDGKKKGKLHIPDIILKSDLEVKRHFIAGFFDADGYIYVKNKDVAISQGTKEILEEFALLLKELNIETRKIYTQYKELGITYNLSLRWSSIENFINTIPFSDPDKMKKGNKIMESLAR